MTFDKCSRIKRSKSTARYYLFATACEQFHTCLGMGLPGVGLHLKMFCCIAVIMNTVMTVSAWANRIGLLSLPGAASTAMQFLKNQLNHNHIILTINPLE